MVDLSEEALLDYHRIVSKTFRSEEEGYGFYNSYAFDKGFAVRRCYVERDTATKEICLRKLKFVCSCQGFREAKHMNKAIKKRKPRNLSRCGCVAKMVIKLNKDTGQWKRRMRCWNEALLKARATRSWSTRETTPCSLIRNPEMISTPGSTTKSKTSNSMTSRRRTETSICRFIPSSHEMEEFFSAAEKQEQQSFRKKYNFCPVNGCPLPGRYEWTRLDC